MVLDFDFYTGSHRRLSSSPGLRMKRSAAQEGALCKEDCRARRSAQSETPLQCASGLGSRPRPTDSIAAAGYRHGEPDAVRRSVQGRALPVFDPEVLWLPGGFIVLSVVPTGRGAFRLPRSLSVPGGIRGKWDNRKPPLAGPTGDSLPWAIRSLGHTFPTRPEIEKARSDS